MCGISFLQSLPSYLKELAMMNYTLADQIASASRYYTQSRYNGGSHCLGDIDHGVLRVSNTEWQHLASRAKTFGARFVTGRGWDGSVDGRAFGHVVADDGSRCKVVLI